MMWNGKIQFTYVDPKAIKIDGYQRDLEESRAQKIAEGFNPHLFDPIVLSKRKNGNMYIIDGQHRMIAAIMAKIDKIPARVHLGLTREQEANLFVDAQLERKPIRAFDRFKAKLIAKDPIFVGINTVAEKGGFEIAPHSASNSPRRLRCITLLVAIYKKAGKDHFQRLVDVLSGLSKSKETGHTNDMFIRPLHRVLLLYGSKVSVPHMVKAFEKVSIEKIVWKAIRTSKVRGSRCVDKLMEIIRTVYNQGKPPVELKMEKPKKASAPKS